MESRFEILLQSDKGERFAGAGGGGYLVLGRRRGLRATDLGAPSTGPG